jgi:hypothetical protein
MKFKLHSHRHALQILENVPEYSVLWKEIQESLEIIDEKRLVAHFQTNFEGKAVKSLSRSINSLIDMELVEAGWNPQSQIFGESKYGDHTWRLDFAKSTEIPVGDVEGSNKLEVSGISIEVAFNHQGNIAWNLIKPVIASEINHVQKALQTGVGIVICATEELKQAGGFDGAVGTFDNFVSNLLPLRNLLTVPILIVGLEAPETFRMKLKKSGNQTFGEIEYL